MYVAPVEKQLDTEKLESNTLPQLFQPSPPSLIQATNKTFHEILQAQEAMSRALTSLPELLEQTEAYRRSRTKEALIKEIYESLAAIDEAGRSLERARRKIHNAATGAILEAYYNGSHG